MSSELTRFLRATEVEIDDRECRDFLNLETTSHGSGLVSKSKRSKVGSYTHNRVLFVHASIGIPEGSLWRLHEPESVNSKPIWPDRHPLSAIAWYEAQWLYVDDIDECDITRLLAWETLLDSKLWTSLLPAQPVRLAIWLAPTPCRLIVASVIHVVL